MDASEPSPALDTVDGYIAQIEHDLNGGLDLSPEQNEVRATLTALLEAEATAREAFAGFYATQTPTGDPAASLSVPGDVAARINRWVNLRQEWDALVARRFPTSPALSPASERINPARFTGANAPRRTGPRLRASLPDVLRVPTARPARDAFAMLFAGHAWQSDETAGVAWATNGDTTVQIDADDTLGFGVEQAVSLIARHGASVAQTFLALIGLYLEQNPPGSSNPHGDSETYVTAHASDLLRYQQRRETPRGGYHREDLLAKGRDVYLLSRLSLPRAAEWRFSKASETSGETSTALHIGRLLSVDALDVADLALLGTGANEENPSAGRSVVRFRYHLGREVYEWVAGDNPQYAGVSGKLLTYHPIRQKYQILLGFCLAYYDRVNRKNASETRTIRLPALLSLAAVAIPDRRIAEFLSSIEEALNDLSRTGVVPGLKLVRPANWPELLARRAAREVIAQSVVTFPRLLAPVQVGGTAPRSFLPPSDDNTPS